MKYKALPGRLIVKIHPNKHQEQKTASGIVLPENEKNVKDITYWIATVTDSSSDEIKIGDVVVFGKYAGSTLTGDYVSVLVSDILGILASKQFLETAVNSAWKTIINSDAK